MGKRKPASRQQPLTPELVTQVGQALERGMLAHQQGQLASAAQIYQQILAHLPHHADALHLLGLVHHQQGQSDLGEKLIRRAIAADDQQPLFFNNLGDICLSRGKANAALRAFQSALKLDPSNPVSRQGLAESLFAGGQIEAAVTAYRSAIESTANDAGLHNNLGNALRLSGQYEAASHAYAQALTLDPTNINAIENQAKLMADQGQTQQAAQTLESWIDQQNPPEDCRHKLLRLLATLYGRGWNREAALATLNQLPDTVRQQPAVVYQYGQLLEELLQLDAAIDHYHTALTADGSRPMDDPYRAQLHARIGVCHEQLGNKSSAESAYRRALAIDKSCLAAIEGLESLNALSIDILEEMLSSLKPNAPSSDKQARITFLKGRLQQKQQNHDAAFKLFLAANRLVAKQRPFDRSHLAQLTDSTIKQALALPTAANQSQGSAPIFIVGMPRSGTTLVERLLATQPTIRAGGERDDLRRLIAELERTTSLPFPNCIAELSGTLRQDLDNLYQQWLQPLTSGGKRPTDKLPSNYLRIGLIASLWPNARIIHCQRDPRDVALSCYTTHFTQGQSFSYDLKHLAFAYQQYDRLMTHWHKVLPGKILDVQYESLVADTETQARQIFEYCDLPWSGQDLDFSRQNGPVRTASLWQVRQPIYNSSVGRWKPYEKHLQPFIKAIPELIPES